MARKPVVSRTFKKTVATILCLDCTTAEPENRTYSVAKTGMDDAALLKYLKAEHDTDDFKLVKVVDTQVEEHLYSMDVDKFIELAEELPLRDAEEAEEAEE